MKRLLSLLLTFCLTASLLPAQVQAAENASSGGLDRLGIRQISEKEYAMTPDVKEYEWILNNGALTQQMMGHVMEVKVGEGSTASIAAGYSDDDIETIKTGRNWAMTETTKQAQSMQTRRKTNVVGAINAGGYDMSNGRPSGAFIMSSTPINEPTGTTFWIDASGDAHITDAQKCNAALAEGNVLEAVASFGDIFVDGHARSDLDNSTRASRTAIGIKADGTVVMFMVDGRQAPYSVGMTMAEVAASMEDLGCVQAINLDGGGSSTFATQREGEPESSTAGLTLRCRPSDGYERKVSNTIMVLSTAKPTGQFDHAVLTPNDEVYTPGSTVQFEATGIDAAGGKAEIPAGASWAVLSGNGRIDANGLYTAADTCGEVEVGLKAGGKTIGQTRIQVQWPDKLDFTNNSVSIDFGQTSDLTFKPTWQGRVVHYKDGDFVWSVDPTYYKFDALVDPKANNTKGDFSMAITPDTLEKDTVVVEYYAWGSSLTYTSTYRVTELVPSTENGAMKITAKVEYVSSGGAIGEKKPANLEQTFSAYIGKFSGNKFVADAESSLRGTIHVALTTNSTVHGEVDVAVGMEPFVLMDFEDHGGVAAAEYWKCHVGCSSAGGSGQLLSTEVKESRLWIRDTTNKGVVFPEGYNRIVSAEEDENVRFGQYAFKLGYDFTNVTAASAVAAADFGFSGDLLVNTMQPTRIGLWINVPKDSAGDTSILKAVLKGAAFEGNLDTAYMKLNADGSVSYVDGKQLTGTAAYVQYYSYNADGTVSGSTLSDWAGKGWTWVEADISAFQMPVDVCRAYTVRVTSPQNCTRRAGYLYIDNLQFIYGTNTNDVTKPVLESVTETSSGTALLSDGSTVLNSGNLTFNAVYSDSELTDKYATGIDTSGIRVLLDGTDYTGNLEINDGSLYLKGVALRNGTHTLTIRLKDFYGNVTTETRTFRVEDAKGMQSAIDILPQPEPPEIGKEYVFAIVNNTGESVTKAELTVDFRAMGNAAKYLAGAKVESLSSDYTLTLDQNTLAKGLAKITVTKPQATQARRAMRTGVQDTDYNYVSELGYLIITIPENAASDSVLKCTVTQGSYTVANDSGTGTAYTFSGTEKVVPMTASYQLTCEQAIAGMSAELTVTDADGKPISRADIYQVSSDGSHKLGSTNMKGTFTKTFDTAGEYTFYAEKAGSGRSWNQRVIVCERTTENGGKPFGILTNGVTKAGTKSITWLTQIDGSAEKAQVKYSTDAELNGAATVDGTSAIQTFVQSTRGDALRSNKVTLTNLAPDTTYYYQVGDGATWSNTQSFKMPAADAVATNFFILGDIQTGDTANLAAALEKLKAESYDFGVQTGDAIDNVTMYETHCRPFLNAVNSGTLGGVDLIHVLGNHEYYGDADGKISKAIYDLPESAQNSWYKMEYGKVCVVVVNHGTKLSETLADIAENLTTDCVWKVLVSHEPIYGTESVSATPAILASIEKAGFSFVFGGDDHAYARTYPMLGGVKQTENSRNGVVYFVCGDLSGKSNKFEKREYYEVFQCDEKGQNRTSLGTTENTAFEVTGLSADTAYYFVAAGRTKVPTEDNKVYTSVKWSNILCATTSPLSANVTAMTATVDGIQIPAVDVDGTNYLFLPASADLANLNVTITRSANDGSLVVAGDQGSQPVNGNAAALNVSALASETDGYRLLTAKVGNGTAFTVRIMQATNLPTIYLTSTNANTQGRSYVDSSKRNTTTAALKMIDAAGSEISTMDIKELKARGNSTFTYAAKKSYQMKLETASDLLQNGENVKTWVLLANYFDATLMHDKLFKDMAAALEMPYTASCDWVNLYYDGEYRGVYLLSEKNAVKDTGINITDLEAAYKNQNPEYGTNMTTATGTNAYGGSYTYTTGLTDPTDITGGYLLELNHDAPDEVNGFVTKKGKGVNVKSPEWCGDAAMEYISEYYQAFENAVYAMDENGNYTGINDDGKHYYEYVDRDSLVKIFLLQELALSPDGFISSLYFYKDANGIMYAGPIWDQDMTLGTGWTKYISPDTTDYHYLAEALIQIPDFREAVIAYYNATFAPQANALITEDGTIYGYADCLADSAEMNFVLWPYIRVGDPNNAEHIWKNTTYASVLADMQNWLTQRIAKLDVTFVETVFVTGDVNGDGVVNISDAVALLRYLAGDESVNIIIGNSDMNGDGTVNISDAVTLLRRLAGYND